MRKHAKAAVNQIKPRAKVSRFQQASKLAQKPEASEEHCKLMENIEDSKDFEH